MEMTFDFFHILQHEIIISSIIKLPNPHDKVQHSTGCEDSPYSSLVLKASLSTVDIFTGPS